MKKGTGERGRYLREKNIFAPVGKNFLFQLRLVFFVSRIDELS